MKCGIKEVIDIEKNVDIVVVVFECNEALVSGVINGKPINTYEKILNHSNSCKGVS
jgi:hypothetical protein